MGTFISSNTALPTNKTDANPPTGITSELKAADINNIWTALSDVRDHVKGWVNPASSAYGALMDGGTDDAAALAAAAADASSKGYGLFIPGKVRVASGTTTITTPIRFGGGGSLDIRTGATVAINGAIDAPINQIFFMNGGTLTLDKKLTRIGYPEWWGALPGGGDCLAGLQYALAALSTVQLQAADYFISATLNIVTPYVEMRGAGQARPYSTGGTRIIVRSATADCILIGTAAAPVGGVNSFLPQVRVSNIEVTRDRVVTPPGVGLEESAAAGIRLKYTLYTYIDNVWSTENSLGFALKGTVQSHLTNCFAFRSLAANSPTNDLFWGYVLFDASIGLAGGNASSYLAMCNASLGGSISATGASPIISVGFVHGNSFVDTFLIWPETSACQIGIGAYGAAAGTLSAQKSGNADFHVVHPIIDTFTQYGIYLTDLSNYAAVSVIDGYFAPGATGTACIAVNNSSGPVMLTDNECLCWPFPDTRGLYISSSSKVMSKNIINGSHKPVELNASSLCRVTDNINNPNEVAVQGAVYLTGASTRNYIAPIVGGGSTMFPKGVQLNGTSPDYNEINCTGIDPASLTSGAANKLVINGTQVTTTGLSGNNLASGVMQ